MTALVNEEVTRGTFRIVTIGPAEPLLECTIPERLEATAAKFPDRPALVVRHQGVRWTWRELASQVDCAARGLASLGIAPGDRVGVWASNGAEWVVLMVQ